MANRKNIPSVRFKKEGKNGKWRGTIEAQIHVARPKSPFSPRCLRFELLRKGVCKFYLDIEYK